MTRKSIQYLGAASALAMAVSLACAGGAAAQGATSTLRGTIYEGQAVESGGSITATEVATGDAGYVLTLDGAVSPPGGFAIRWPAVETPPARVRIDGRTAEWVDGELAIPAGARRVDLR